MPSPVRFTITGDREMAAKIRKAAKKFPEEARAALFAEGEYVMGRSKNEFVPVRNSILKNSGHVVMARTGLTVDLVFGGPAKAYALAVHEHPSRHDPPSWKGGVTFRIGGPGYLKKPMDQEAPKMSRRLAKKLNIEKMT